MGEFKLGRMTLRSLFSKPATEAYPVQPRAFYEQTKGHVVIDPEKCRYDGSCAVLCPTGAIEVDRHELTWAIDRFRCVQCRNCINVCVEDALSMDHLYAPSASIKHIDVFTLSEQGRAERRKAEEEKRARAAKLREQAAAKKKAAAEAEAKPEAAATPPAKAAPSAAPTPVDAAPAPTEGLTPATPTQG